MPYITNENDDLVYVKSTDFFEGTGGWDDIPFPHVYHSATNVINQKKQSEIKRKTRYQILKENKCS